MYSIECVQESLIKYKRDFIKNLLTTINSKLVSDNTGRDAFIDSIYINVCNKFFDKTLDNVVNSIVELGENIKDIPAAIASYYGLFRRSINIKTSNVNVETTLNEDVIEKGMEMCISKLIEINLVKRMIEIPYDDWIIDNSVFGDFESLTEVLDKTELSNEEQFSVVMDIIWKNLNTDLIKDDDIKDFKFYSVAVGQANGFSNEQIVDIVSDEKYMYLLDKDDSELTPLEQRQKKVLVESTAIYEDEKENYDLEKIRKDYNDIKEHYFDKLNDEGNLENFTSEDFNIVISKLEKFGVTRRFLNISRHILARCIKTVENKTIKWNSTITETVTTVNDDEYIRLKKKVEEVYDMHKGMVKRPLSTEEVYFYAGLMLKMGEQIGNVKTLFDRGLKKADDPVERYKLTRDKLKYYENELCLGEDIKEMDELYQEAISASRKDRKIWSSMLEEHLESLKYIIPKYEYELERAKEFIKRK